MHRSDHIEGSYVSGAIVLDCNGKPFYPFCSILSTFRFPPKRNQQEKNMLQVILSFCLKYTFVLYFQAAKQTFFCNLMASTLVIAVNGSELLEKMF